MKFTVEHLASTDSTNRWLAEHGEGHDMMVWTDYQTAGRGCGQNTWESEAGKNLLFSMLIHPQELKATEQFRISMAISLAMIKALAPMAGQLHIKWPNDIYWHDRKLAGILIENRLSGQLVRQSIIGVGLNVNQTEFLSNAPNPVSLRQITGQEHDREALLNGIADAFTLDIDAFDYRALLYRHEGFFPYQDAEGTFEAELETVEDDGHLILRDHTGRLRRYAFKEVSFLLPTTPTTPTKPTK